MLLCKQMKIIKKYIIMNKMVFKISELEQFADIMAIQDDQWLIRFKMWYQKVIQSYCDHACLSLISDYELDSCYNLPIGELSKVYYNSYYDEVLKSIRYVPDKFQWWENALENYNFSKSAYDRFKGKGLMYIISNFKRFKKVKKRLKVREKELSISDIAEIAFERYVFEKRGNLLSFKTMLKNTGG